MAYVAPTTRANGYVVDASEWNQSVVDNVKYLKDAPVFDGAVTASSTLTVANNVGLAATKKLYLDGVAMSGDTYISESSANVLSLFSGNVEAKLTSGVLTVSGFGTHSFDAGGTGQNIFRVRNSTAGTGNSAYITLANDNNTDLLMLQGFSSTYTTSGPFVASGSAVRASGSGGISVTAEHASGAIRFYSGGTTERVRITTGGSIAINSNTALYLDGVAGNGNTYIYEASADNIYVVTGGNSHLFNTTGFAPVAMPTTASASNVHYPSDGNYLYRVTSLRAAKKDITTIDPATARRVLGTLNPVWYRSAINGDEVRQWPGFIAEEVAAVDPRLAMFDPKTGELQSVAYDRFAAYAIVGWQQHDATIQSLAARIAALESK